MSLDVYLFGEEKEKSCTCHDCGHVHNMVERECLFSANITHNLSKMADKAGIYDAIWNPSSIGSTAADLIAVIEKGLHDMKANPNIYKTYDASNGWGTYDDFIPWIESYLDACKRNPTAIVLTYK